MPYQNKNEIANSLTKGDILSAIAQYQPRDWSEASKSGNTKTDLIRIAKHDTLEHAFRQKTILKMMR